jgi:hypothetical protein
MGRYVSSEFGPKYISIYLRGSTIFSVIVRDSPAFECLLTSGGGLCGTAPFVDAVLLPIPGWRHPLPEPGERRRGARPAGVVDRAGPIGYSARPQSIPTPARCQTPLPSLGAWPDSPCRKRCPKHPPRTPNCVPTWSLPASRCRGTHLPGPPGAVAPGGRAVRGGAAAAPRRPEGAGEPEPRAVAGRRVGRSAMLEGRVGKAKG